MKRRAKQLEERRAALQDAAYAHRYMEAYLRFPAQRTTGVEWKSLPRLGDCIAAAALDSDLFHPLDGTKVMKILSRLRIAWHNPESIQVAAHRTPAAALRLLDLLSSAAESDELKQEILQFREDVTRQVGQVVSEHQTPDP